MFSVNDDCSKYAAVRLRLTALYGSVLLSYKAAVNIACD